MVGRDEAKTFVRVEELNRAARHSWSPVVARRRSRTLSLSAKQR
jgi:hypothetical protein